MDWTLSGGVPCVSLISLGTFYQDKYYISDDCLHCLDEIKLKLNREDVTARPLRRALGFMDILNKDLIPILIHSKDEPKIFRETIKLLVELTVPVECLICVDTSNQSPTSQHVVHELTQLLYSAKEAFLDPRPTRAIIDHMFQLTEKELLSKEDTEAVNTALLLIRNILHAPERPPQQETVDEPADREGSPTFQSHTSYLGPHSHSHGYTPDCSQQNRLLWNLFAQGIDRLLVKLLSLAQKEAWVVTIVQLIALFYKDQHVENMQKLLGSWLDTTSSDSSEDDESNTSPLIGECNSPQILTSSSDPTSDSSDSAQRNGSNPSAGILENEPQLSDLKLGKKSLHKLSSASSAPGGDTASCSAVSQHSSASIVTDKSRRSHHSTSSGFHSETSSVQASVRNETIKEQPCETKVSVAREPKRRHNPSTVTHQQTENRDGKAEPSTSSEAVESSAKRLQKTSGRSNQPEKEQRRKKLYKRSRSMGRKKVKAVMHYMPTEEDISQLMKDFTVDFLLKGYNSLVGELHQQLIHQEPLPLDKSHFLWLITYFLRFASQLEVDLKHLRNIFTIDLLSYLTWEAVVETEEFEMTSLIPMSDLKPCLRRLHLGVTAIREYLQALETYSRLSHLSEDDRLKISVIRANLPAIRDLRQVFLLQLRHFNPVIQSRRYLRDVITANHVLLLTLERAAVQSPFKDCFEVQQHLTQFCSRTVLSRYGTALEDFRTNGPFVNDCILTLLHHIGADLGRADLLCEPVILRPFSKIWEEEFNMCDDWDDLIEFVVQKFLRNYNSSHSDVESNGSRSGGSRSMESDQVPCARTPETGSDLHPGGSSCEPLSENLFKDPISDIDSVKGQLMDSGYQKQLHWIQESLLTVCSARLGTYKGQEFKFPIACLSLEMNVPCPMVPWTDLEASALRSDLFMFLLHRMGLLPGNNVGLFPRIPREWDVNALYSVALFFGPIEQNLVDFDLTRVHRVDLPIPNSPDDLPMGTNPHWLPPYLGPGPSTSFSVMPHHWLHWVEQSGSLFRSAEVTSHEHSSHSISNQSHRPMDSVSTTSSLEVHKTDSSDDEEMEENSHLLSMNSGHLPEDGRPWLRAIPSESSNDDAFEMASDSDANKACSAPPSHSMAHNV